MKNPNSALARAARSNRPTKRIRVPKSHREPLEAPSYPEIFTTTKLAPGSAIGAHDQTHFKTRLQGPTSF